MQWDCEATTPEAADRFEIGYLLPLRALRDAGLVEIKEEKSAPCPGAYRVVTVILAHPLWRG